MFLKNWYFVNYTFAPRISVDTCPTVAGKVPRSPARRSN